MIFPDDPTSKTSTMGTVPIGIEVTMSYKMQALRIAQRRFRVACYGESNEGVHIPPRRVPYRQAMPYVLG